MSRIRLAALAGILTALLAGCATSTGTTSSTADSDTGTAATTTVKHAYGETVIEGQPARVATVSWANHEVPLALGVVPVGMSKATWGDDDGDGVLPWVEDKLNELGADTPVLFDETDGLPFEEIAATEPDVILAAYSGLTQEDYDQLSKIAPTVAFPEVAWGTSYEQMIELNAAGMGRAEAGKELISQLASTTAEAFATHPELAGKTVLFTAFGQDDKSTVGFYTTHDTRPGFLAANGVKMPQIVLDESAKTDAFWVTVSAEKPELFDDVDLIVAYGSNDAAENAKSLAELQADPLLGKIKAIAAGNVAFVGSDPLAASANPSPLSIPATLSSYLDLLSAGFQNK